jgi:hypothetical protein
MNLHASFAKVKLHHFLSKQIWFEYLLCIGVRMLLIAVHFAAGMQVTHGIHRVAVNRQNFEPGSWWKWIVIWEICCEGIVLDMGLIL